MANNSLKNALQNAGLTTEEFADIIKVDPKSVQRWVDGPTKPYPRNRAAIARALDLSEQELWPDETSVTGPGSETVGRARRGSSEISGTWASATNDDAPDPVALIQNSDDAIELLDNGRGIDLTLSLLAAILEQADTGRKVRLLTSLPKLRLKPIIGHQNTEVCVIEGSTGHSLLRADDTMLLTFNLAGEGDQPPPLLRLTRTAEAGLFERLVANFDTLWEHADELTAPQQLDAYLTNTDQDDPNEDRLGPSRQDPPPAPDQTPRRWPRRPE
jgi:lambda repressor-like predicted transcriptional regulator